MLSEKEMWLSEEERIESRKIMRAIHTETQKILIEMKNQPCNRIYILNKIQKIEKGCALLNLQLNNLIKRGNYNE